MQKFARDIADIIVQLICWFTALQMHAQHATIVTDFYASICTLRKSSDGENFYYFFCYLFFVSWHVGKYYKTHTEQIDTL